MHALWTTLLAVALAASSAVGQAPQAGTPLACAQSPATNAAPPGVEQEVDKRWSFSGSAYTYFVPDSHEYVQPTFTADRGWLHLETRYNYEDLETGSAWGATILAGGTH